MKLKIRMVCERTYEVDPKNYGFRSRQQLTDPKAMLSMDLESVQDDPEMFMAMCFDDQDEEGVTFEVTGEVVED